MTPTFAIASKLSDLGAPTDVMTVPELLEQIDALDGRMVWVRGVLSLEFESQELRDGQASLWVDVDVSEEAQASIPTLNGRQVVVHGTVNRSAKGHMGLWPAGLTVDRIVKAKERRRGA